MTRRIVLLVIVAVLVVVATGSIAASDQTPQQQIQQLRNKLRNARLNNSDLQVEIDAQDALISDQGDTIARLRARLASQPDPLDAVTARSPDGLWAAMVAIWQAFPTIDAGQLCGYDKGQNPGNGIPLTVTSYSFIRVTGC